MKEYAIYDYKPAFCYGGGHKVNAFPTFGKTWLELREFLPPDACKYAIVQATNKSHALKLARERWLK